ncbi:Thioredoxin reductase [Cryobacterium psychrotolerans]|uniref:Thioredoxin reductase n=1 Tax=Cryobacterium psychrotolerans TaxID=386301 RepID=A0A1G9DTW4_9MICO|nr:MULTISPECIES: NAD(P)/FAD-dependent oxidoreductase [Cryobacterium]TFD40946.1 NAD(P)/FAD-dependent oxidoreductase [Cryobacterium sp. TMT1-2-1]TFD83408.1 NAD(P)/FAD-dependent oxidoreductase [Cryobacterium psychrotolerans]SDK67321.1 Thioredoxin reductase [Cryobacterium psychrotolerans]
MSDEAGSSAHEAYDSDAYDCVVIGAGPAGLSAALNLTRARQRVLVVDSDRPRHAATMLSHGFLTRDGVPPHELRRIAREELERYPEAEILRRSTVDRVERNHDRDEAGGAHAGAHPFTVRISGRTAAGARVVRSRTVVVATGLRETLPALPSIRAYYGMSLFSCAACDGYEQGEGPVALIGETDDLFARALLVGQWSSTVTVFTNGVASLTAHEESELGDRGIRVERRVIDDLEGERGAIAAVRLFDGERIPVTGGFVRPLWHPIVGFLGDLDLDTDASGHLVTDRDGRTSLAGVYAAGDVAAPGPQQLIVAAGAGARAAAIITHDLLGVTTAH